MGRKSAFGSGIQDEQPGSYFLELRNHFFGLKYLNSLMRIRDPESGMETVRIRDPGWKKVRSGIRNKHPGSATLKKWFPSSRKYDPVCSSRIGILTLPIPDPGVKKAPDPGSGSAALFSIFSTGTVRYLLIHKQFLCSGHFPRCSGLLHEQQRRGMSVSTHSYR
jgi:hypothetical protein